MIKGRKREYSRKIKEGGYFGGGNGKAQQYWKLRKSKHNPITWI